MECVICCKNIFCDFSDGSQICDRRHHWACKHYRICDVTYSYLLIELIQCLSMVQYLQNNVIMKLTTRFTSFIGWIPLKYGLTATPPIIAPCQNLWCQASNFTLWYQNLQYKSHPEFWPPRRIFKTSFYHKTCLILENWRYLQYDLCYLDCHRDCFWHPGIWQAYWLDDGIHLGAPGINNPSAKYWSC